MDNNMLQMPKSENELNAIRHHMLTLIFHNGYSGKTFLEVATQDFTKFSKYIGNPHRFALKSELDACKTDRDKIAEWYRNFVLILIAENIDEIIKLLEE